jgi:hypothetical protein
MDVYSFKPNNSFRFSADIDNDGASPDNPANYRTVLFNNGVAPNTVPTVTFLFTGQNKTVRLDD